MQYSAFEKQQMCKDLFESELFLDHRVFYANEEEESLRIKAQVTFPQHPNIEQLITEVKNLPIYYTDVMKLKIYDEEITDICLVCTGFETDQDGNRESVEIVIAYGYLKNVFLIYGNSPKYMNRLLGLAYILPSHTPMDQNALEDHYMNMREVVDKLKALSEESALILKTNFIEQIENVMEEQVIMQNLCKSVFETDFFRNRLIKFETQIQTQTPTLTLTQTQEQEQSEEENYSSDTIPVTVALQTIRKEFVEAAVRCTVKENNAVYAVYDLIRTYFDNFSIFVGKERGIYMDLHVFFHYVPVLHIFRGSFEQNENSSEEET